MAKPLVLTVDATMTPLERALRSGKATLADFGASADELLRKMDENFQNGFRSSGASLAASLGRTMQAQFSEMKRGAEAAMAMGKDWDPLNGTNSASSAKQAAGYQQAADAANVRVGAIQRVLQAEEAAGTVDAGRILQLKTMLVATKELALGMEEQAGISRSQAAAFEAVEAEMGRTAGAAGGVVNAHNRMGISGQMMMHSVRSTADSFAAGLPPMMIFSEQISRVSEAMVYAAQESGRTEGAMAKFASFMGGPWGIAATAGISILATLAGHMDLFQDKVGEAAKKLKEQAEATQLADQAQAVFDNTLDGAIAKERKLNDELKQQLQTRRQIIGLQVAGAQEGEIELKTKVDAARQDYNQAVAARDAAVNAPYSKRSRDNLSFSVHESAVRQADADVAAKRKVLDDAVKGYLDSQTTALRAQAVQMQADAKDRATPQAAKQAALEKRKQDLTTNFVAGAIGNTEYQSGLDAIEVEEAANKKTPRKPRQDRTAQREAEAEKKSDAAYDVAYAKAEEDLATIARQNVTDLQELSSLDKAAIDAARVKERRATEEQGRREQWSVADIEALQLKQDEVAEARKRAIDDKTMRESFDRSLDYQKNVLSFQNQMLSIQGQLAPTQKDRLRLALEILENERQSSILDIRRDVNDGRKTADEGDTAIANANKRFDAQREIVSRQNASPMTSYKNDLVRSAGDMNTALQNVEVDGLKGLQDGLTGLITGTESVSQAFTRMATSILADLARVAIEKSLMVAFGLSTGGKVEGRASGGLVGYRTGGIPGFATGVRLSNNMIRGPGTGTSDSVLAMVGGVKPIRVSAGEGIVNERAVKDYWPIIDAMNKGTFSGFASGGLPGGGAMPSLAYPKIPSSASLRQQSHTVLAPVTFDLTNTITTPELMQQMVSISQRHAAAALAAAPDLSMQRMTQKQNNRIP